MVVHGGIDGFSRFIVFLTCNNNNKSETVAQLFEKAIHEYGVPDRIRTDKGGENIKVQLSVWACPCHYVSFILPYHCYLYDNIVGC